MSYTMQAWSAVGITAVVFVGTLATYAAYCAYVFRDLKDE